MRTTLTCTTCLIFLALTAAYPAQAARPTAEEVEVIDDVQEYVGRARKVVEHAHVGVYGRLSRKQVNRVDNAQLTIEQIFSGKTGDVVLSEDEQIQLANAQEAINAIIRADDKSRLICTKSPEIGTRIPKTECLSVAQREQRAEDARFTARVVDEFYCVAEEELSSCRQ